MTGISLNCTKCGGSGLRGSAPAVGASINERRACVYCDGRGKFPALDVPAIVAALTGRGGVFRKSRPTVGGARSYFVWRYARFYGGADVTFPIMATVDIAGDPMAPVLDRIATTIARKRFGTDRVAAVRWASALSGDSPEPSPDLPSTAYPNGPVCTHGKPDDELAEFV